MTIQGIPRSTMARSHNTEYSLFAGYTNGKKAEKPVVMPMLKFEFPTFFSSVTNSAGKWKNWLRTMEKS
uniref:Uncharacterized protein n=1 Tax=Onchocerca volvulus TaxID=6282 RepID=A0A8R1XVM6_ONCVO